MSRYKGCWTEIIAAAEQIPPAKLALTFAVIYTSASIFFNALPITSTVAGRLSPHHFPT